MFENITRPPFHSPQYTFPRSLVISKKKTLEFPLVFPGIQLASFKNQFVIRFLLQKIIYTLAPPPPLECIEGLYIPWRWKYNVNWKTSHRDWGISIISVQNGHNSIIDLCSICVFNWIPNNKLKVFIYFPSPGGYGPSPSYPLSFSLSLPPSLFSTINYSDTDSITPPHSETPPPFTLSTFYPQNEDILCFEVSRTGRSKWETRIFKIGYGLHLQFSVLILPWKDQSRSIGFRN